MSKNKILSMDELQGEVSAQRASGRRVVLCHGVFDLLHIGHIRYLRTARDFGDVLVVTLTPDRYVDKGPGRPAFDENHRAEMLAALDVVDYVCVNSWPTAEQTLRALRPDFYIKGSEFRQADADMTGKIGREAAVCEEIGTKLDFVSDIVFSSSNLINRYFSSQPQEIVEYLNLFKTRYSLDFLTKCIDEMKGLNVLVVGDVIIDEYMYAGAIGKSSKDPILAMQYQSKDEFIGGSAAVANHVAGFAGSVTLLGVLGDEGGACERDFVTSGLKSNVTPVLFTRKDAPTVRKRRIIDGYSLNKLLEIYHMDDTAPDNELEADIMEYLKFNIGKFDLVLAADFGHGTISAPIADVLMKSSPYFAVNTQANAGNRGFHTISKYAHADFVSLAEHEMRLETRDNITDLGSIISKYAHNMGTRHFAVTRGRSGCAIFADDFVQIPAFAVQVIDRVGAGDALLSVGAMASRLNLPVEVIGFLGNMTGALAVQTIGNQKSIDALGLKKAVTAMMK